MATLPPQGVADPATAAYIRRRSLALGRDQGEVEDLIAAKIGENLAFDELRPDSDHATLKADEHGLSRYGDPKDETSETA